MAGRAVSGRRKAVRRFAGETAASILAENDFGRGREVIVLSGGDFSSVDWIDALTDYIGPCHGVIATWTAAAAAADLDRVERWIGENRILSCEWIVDRSFQNRQPAICQAFRDRFGDASIRVAATHAKFSLLWNDDGWRVVALTSANLNQNSRIEFFHAADDADLFTQMREMVDDIFAAQQLGLGFESDAGAAMALKALKRKALTERAEREGIGVMSEVSLR